MKKLLVFYFFTLGFALSAQFNTIGMPSIGYVNNNPRVNDAGLKMDSNTNSVMTGDMKKVRHWHGAICRLTGNYILHRGLGNDAIHSVRRYPKSIVDLTCLQNPELLYMQCFLGKLPI